MKHINLSTVALPVLLSLMLSFFMQASLALTQTTTSMTSLQAAKLNTEADDSDITETALSAIKISPNDKRQAAHWQLTTTEWQRYKTLMKGVAGRWYATLNPPEVLGVLARSDTERAHYAQLVVRQRKARLDRELAFNRAIHRAWVNEYPQLKPVRPFDTRPFRVVKHSN